MKPIKSGDRLARNLRKGDRIPAWLISPSSRPGIFVISAVRIVGDAVTITASGRTLTLHAETRVRVF